MNDFWNIDSLLSAANPVDEARLAEPAELARAQRLFERIIATPDSTLPRKRRARRRASIYLMALVAFVGAGATVSYALESNQPTKRAFVACYAQAQLQSSFVVLAAGNLTPIGGCRTLWAGGKLAGGMPPAEPLAACLLPSGGVGVFPDPAPGGTCTRLHLKAVATPRQAPPAKPANSANSANPAAPPSPADGQAPLSATGAITKMTDAVTAALSAACLDADHAKASTVQGLHDSGFDTWTVTTTAPFTTSRPCASPGFDEAHHQVLIIPIPPKG